ncbi:MAG: NADH-quinone oxidoreductase subunit H, partial [Candidatus Bathyarchaeota archaeon]|nr:NADH-quinone oxidoreductase subunit H [Candidatus Bathyarchaeota archaeon]
LLVSLFLGWPGESILFGPSSVLCTVWFVVKVLLVIFMLEFIGCMCARLRIDQVVWANWRIMIPLAILSLILTVACAPLFESLIG